MTVNLSGEKFFAPKITIYNMLSLEPTTGLEPVNLFLTKEVLYLLSYVGLCA